MSQLTPCPQCHSERVWARAALGAFGVTHVAFCPGCARAATICTRCGTELELVRQPGAGSPGLDAAGNLLQCPACRQEATAAAPPLTGAASRLLAGSTRRSAAAPDAIRPRRAALSSFVPGISAPPVVQRVADDSEHLAATRYTRRRRLVGLVDDAARRADALARLEAELSRLEVEPEG